MASTPDIARPARDFTARSPKSCTREFIIRLAAFASAASSLAAISFILTGATATWTPAEARQPHLVCRKSHRACLDGCNKKWVSPEFRRSCYSRCDADLKSCDGITSGAPAKKAQSEPDKTPPKSSGVHTPPTGGTKADPKKPPKVNDTRAPVSGGVFHSKSSGTGSSGPILRTTGAGQPSMKSNGTSAPSGRSGGRQ